MAFDSVTTNTEKSDAWEYQVIDHIERLVNMLKRDEAQEIEEVKVPSSPPGDDEDERIEEI